MRFFTSIYFILLAYIILAIGFWEWKLQKQNGSIYAQQVITLRTQIDSSAHPYEYREQMDALHHTLSMRKTQYVGEGATFLFVILIGAFVVYRSFARRIILSRQQNNFMLSVTHELKSPIAAMKLNLQTLEKRQLSDEQKAQLIDRCIRESNRLNDLCNNMLLASQLEGRQYKTQREDINLSALMEDIITGYANRYPQRFEEELTPGIHIYGDRVMLEMAVNNLLENAIKYTPADKLISVSLSMKQNVAVIVVADNGTGIPESEKKHIFEKFYRVGNEESRKAKGTGLGLYLTNKIVLQHKGRITVKDNTPSGSVFEISIPM